MNWMNFLKTKKFIVYSILTYSLLQFTTYSILLSKCINELYAYSSSTGRKVLTNKIAINLGDLIDDSLLFKLFLMCVILLSILPILSFYQYYIGEKSIYTLLRLPRKRARLNIYFEQILPSITGIFVLWLVQFLLLILFYFMYVVLVPKGNHPPFIWNNLWLSSITYELYPIMKPLNFIVPLNIGIWVPSINMLIALAERSRKQCIEAIVGILLVLYVFYQLSTSTSEYAIIMFPFITLITIGMGLYYMYHKQIV